MGDVLLAGQYVFLDVEQFGDVVRKVGGHHGDGGERLFRDVAVKAAVEHVFAADVLRGIIVVRGLRIVVDVVRDEVRQVVLCEVHELSCYIVKSVAVCLRHLLTGFFNETETRQYYIGL